MPTPVFSNIHLFQLLYFTTTIYIFYFQQPCILMEWNRNSRQTLWIILGDHERQMTLFCWERETIKQENEQNKPTLCYGAYRKVDKYSLAIKLFHFFIQIFFILYSHLSFLTPPAINYHSLIKQADSGQWFTKAQEKLLEGSFFVN